MERYVLNLAEHLNLIYASDSEVTGHHRHYPHTHNYCELYFYIEGSCSYMVENGYFDMPYGTVIFTRPGELHCVQIDEPCLYRRYYYELPPDALAFLGSEHMRCFLERPFGKRNSLILPREIMDQCVEKLTRDIELCRSKSPDARSVALADFLYILYEINRVFDQNDNIDMPMRRNALMSQTLEYINSHLGEIGSTSDIASALYVSREYLSRTFTRYAKLTLSKYLTLKRIETAKSLIHSGVPPMRAGEECGFHDYSYFIKIFRAETGMTPYEYRKSDSIRNRM